MTPLSNLLHLLILHFHTATTTAADNIYMKGSQLNAIVYFLCLMFSSSYFIVIVLET